VQGRGLRALGQRQMLYSGSGIGAELEVRSSMFVGIDAMYPLGIVVSRYCSPRHMSLQAANVEYNWAKIATHSRATTAAANMFNVSRSGARF